MVISYRSHELSPIGVRGDIHVHMGINVCLAVHTAYLYSTLSIENHKNYVKYEYCHAKRWPTST
jgi:hypothetical protein